MSAETLFQLIGVIGFSMFALSFQLLKPRHTIFMQAFANLVLAVHFYGLGYIFPAYVPVIASLRDFASALLPRKIQLICLGVFVVLLYGGWAYAGAGWTDSFALIGSTFAALAQVFRGCFYRYRFCLFAHQSLWLSVYISVMSVAGMIFMSGIWVSNVIGIARYYFGQKGVSSQEQKSCPVEAE